MPRKCLQSSKVFRYARIRSLTLKLQIKGKSSLKHRVRLLICGPYERFVQFHTIFDNERRVITVTYFKKRKYLEVRLDKKKEFLKK